MSALLTLFNGHLRVKRENHGFMRSDELNKIKNA